VLAVRPDIIIEINAQPDRLDLPYDIIKTLKGRVKFTIASDKHDNNSLVAVELAVKEARKAGLTKDDIFNPLTPKESSQILKS
jgi:histidinol phosphatase-like PHP family hydrolase